MIDTASNTGPLDAIDVFVDLSGIKAGAQAIRRLIDGWSRQDNIGATARRLTGTLPSGMRPKDLLPLPANWSLSESPSPSSALNSALDMAGRQGVPLLLLTGAVEINNEAVGVLRRCLERDPTVRFRRSAHRVQRAMLLRAIVAEWRGFDGLAAPKNPGRSA